MRARLFMLLAGAAVLCLPSSASAYCLHKYSGATPFAKWKQLPVPYRVSETLTDAALLAAVDAAFQTWAAVPCSGLAFRNDGAFAATEQFQHNNAGIYVFWYTKADDFPGGFPVDPKYVAYTMSAHDNDGGIAWASIAINAFAFKWNASGGNLQQAILDVQNELIYQIGSVIGLADSNVTGTVMDPKITYGSTARHTLSQDDKNAVVHLYPKDNTCTAPAPGANGCSSGGPPAGDGGGTLPGQDGGSSAGDATVPPIGDGGVVGGNDSGNAGNTDGSTSGDTALGGAGADDDGCSCRAGATGGAGSLPMLLVIMALLWARRRRH